MYVAVLPITIIFIAHYSTYSTWTDGGNDAQTALACSGGRHSTTCFSLRFMWRKKGRGEFYAYLPQHSANDALCNVPPMSTCNDEYGTSVGRGAFNFTVGEWNHISERIRLNDAGQANGEIQLFFNGVSVINVGGLVLRDNAAGRIRGIHMQTFFGGGCNIHLTLRDIHH